MANDQTKKEALFNEVKGSLFEFLVARRIASLNNDELSFLKTLDKNYLNVLSQQDRMVRQFYPEMQRFLEEVSQLTVDELFKYFISNPSSPKLTGKFSNSSIAQELHEADLFVQVKDKLVPLSLKLNKKNAYVNTKSGGIKSFLTQYFPFVDKALQDKLNQLVDHEFSRMAFELHAIHDMEYPGNFVNWVKRGFSELPGELSAEERSILKSYYARIAREIHSTLSRARDMNPEAFSESLLPLLGFGSSDIVQIICFHEFKTNSQAEVFIHEVSELKAGLKNPVIKDFNDISSVEIEVGHWALQIRVKPMNKFTTTAIKMNCSVKVKRPSDF